KLKSKSKKSPTAHSQTVVAHLRKPKSRMKKVVIVGSSRNDGDTVNLTKQLIEKSKWDLVNLNDYQFSYFDYKHENRNDDYLNLMKEILKKYETLIFVTPIYWY